MKISNTQKTKNSSFTEKKDLQKEESKNTNPSFPQAEKPQFKDFKKPKFSSIIESLLFASPKPLNLHQIKKIFEEEGHEITISQMKEALKSLLEKYQSKESGISLEEISNGFQIRTKPSNAPYIKRLLKTKTFKLSSTALEALSIVAYREPCTKADLDELRGVESGHLLRTLMEKGLIQFLKKSERPGRPMLYGTTKKFLEIFQLKSLKELPSLNEMGELLKKEGQKNEFKEKNQQNFDLFKNKIKKTSHFEKEAEKRKERENQDEKFLDQIHHKLSSLRIQPDFLEKEKKEEKITKNSSKNDTKNTSLKNNISS